MIVIQPNLSTTLCVAALFCALLFLAGLSYKFVGTVLAVTVPTVVIFLAIAVQPNQPFCTIISRAVSLRGWSRKNTRMTSHISSSTR